MQRALPNKVMYLIAMTHIERLKVEVWNIDIKDRSRVSDIYGWTDFFLLLDDETVPENVEHTCHDQTYTCTTEALQI